MKKGEKRRKDEERKVVPILIRHRAGVSVFLSIYLSGLIVYNI